MGLGVTAYSKEDAFFLLEERGFDTWYQGAREIKTLEGVTIEELDQSNIVPNVGPLQLRGVWYPAANIGFGAPKGCEYMPSSTERPRYSVWRLDDNGNESRMKSFRSRVEADAYRDDFTARGHKQTYWVKRNDA